MGVSAIALSRPRSNCTSRNMGVTARSLDVTSAHWRSMFAGEIAVFVLEAGILLTTALDHRPE